MAVTGPRTTRGRDAEPTSTADAGAPGDATPPPPANAGHLTAATPTPPAPPRDGGHDR